MRVYVRDGVILLERKTKKKVDGKKSVEEEKKEERNGFGRKPPT
jgi:hypothetical protein